MKRAAWPLVAVVLVGVLLVAVFPTRTYLNQRRELDAAERRLSVLSAQNRELSARVDRLNTDAEIERLAREQYNLVRPGEEAFAILPPPAAPVTEDVTEDKAAGERSEERPGWWSRLWEGLRFWD